MLILPKLVRTVSFAVLCCFFAQHTARSAVLISQLPAPSANQTIESPFSDSSPQSSNSQQQAAENFSIPSASFPQGFTITQVRWWGSFFHMEDTLANPLNASFTIKFYEDNGGVPGTLLVTIPLNGISGTATVLFAVPEGSRQPDRIYEFDEQISPLTLASSSTPYWISILGPDINGVIPSDDFSGRFRWALSDGGSFARMTNGGDWLANQPPDNLAVELFGEPVSTNVVPEPATFSLLLGGFACAAYWTRRRKFA